MADNTDDRPSSDDPSSVISLNRRVSIEFLENTKGYAVRVPKGQKDPGKGWDPKSASEEKSKIALNAIRHDGDCNLGVHLHGDLVDVDVDSSSPYLMAALDRFLPPSAHTWGRKSRPRTHRVYTIRQENWQPSDSPFLRRIMKWEETKVEVRGGNRTRGEYSLLPGSIHPSGEAYEWANLGRARNSGTVVDIEQIIDAIRKSCAISILAPYWKEGIRNDLVMAFSGFLYRIFSIVGEKPDELFCIDKDTSETLIRAMLSICGDDPADEQARMKTFEMTWKKGESGAPVTGATTLREITGDKDIVRKLYAVLTDGQDMNIIEEFTARFVLWQGPGLAIDLEASARGEAKPYMSRQQFVNSHGHIFVNYMKADGKEGRKQLAEAFWSMSVVTRLGGITFMPGDPLITEEEGVMKVNQWGGFATKPVDERVQQEEIQPFLDYVFEVLACNDSVRRDWILDWVAHIFQRPSQKSGTALVLVGKPGAGKSFLGEGIIVPLIGPKHAATTNSVARLTNGFNVNFDNKIFIQCDEATNNRQKGVSAILNSMITDRFMMIEPKGVDAFQKPNHSRFLLTSNDENDAIFIGHGTDDRRYTIIKVSDKYKDDIVWWTQFRAWTEQNLGKIHKWLLQREIDWDGIKRPLVTEAKAEMQLRSLDPVDMWLRDMVARGFPLSEKIHTHPMDAIPDKNFNDKERKMLRTQWPQYVRYSKLVEDFKLWCRDTHTKYGVDVLNEAMIATELAKRGMKMDKAKAIRKKIYVEDPRTNAIQVHNAYLRPFPTLQELRDHVLKISGVNMDIDESTPGEDEDGSDADDTEF